MDTKPDHYYQVPRDDVLPFIPEAAATVLDVGCAEGTFGSRLKARGAREVWGVEIVDSAAQMARLVLDRVLVGDISDLIDQLPAGYFDLVVFNDVLEHMIDPFSVLERIKSRISPDGVVVSSIPNIRFYPTMHQLLVRKNWEYTESGILDRTHLRFFTVRSIRNMYERLGYEVLRHEGINPMAEIPRTYRFANIVLRGRLSDMTYSQFVTVARPLRVGPPTPAGDAA